MTEKKSDGQHYNFAAIEPKWQAFWRDHKMYQARDFDARPKQYVLVEFPFLSGDGLHVGHCLSYIAQDVIARWKRMSEHNVLYPIGWDAFGLPTENYAIKKKTKPQIVTADNIANFKRQIQALGISFDWSRELSTADPAYYKWTQWIFLQLFRHGLAEKKEMPINWCPSCKIGLAFEEVVDGKCERCGTPVERRNIKQWVLKITKYADRLIDDLDTVNFLPEIKQSQINWIGRSEGAEINFEISRPRHYVLLHGYTGTPHVNFFPWLKNELERRGHTVEVPELPDTNNSDIQKQIGYVLRTCHFDKNTVLLGHSLGSVVAMKIVEQLPHAIHKMVLAAGFSIPKFKDHPRPFEYTFNWEFDWKTIKKNAGSIVLLRDEHDDAVPPERIDELHHFLGGDLVDFVAASSHICGEKEPEVLKAALSFIKVFTTRPDTLFGATYLVLSPEHHFIANHESLITNYAAVKKYIADAARKTERERQESKEKIGIELKGIKAINPANQAEIPIWVADYVLSGYGTGAIMAVPAHDERDFEFATNYKLPVQKVILPESRGEYAMGTFLETKNGTFLFQERDKNTARNPQRIAPFGGGVEDGEHIVDALKRELQEELGLDIAVSQIESIGTFDSHVVQGEHVHMFMVRGVDKEAVTLKEGRSIVELSFEEALRLEKVTDFTKQIIKVVQTGKSGAYAGKGMIVNSDNFDGMSSEEAKWKITEKVGGKRTTQYKLRDWIFSRQHYWGEPIPIIHCEKCGTVPLDEKDLPLTLPDVEYYEPTDTGESPLAKITDWVNVKCPQCGGAAKRETDTMPNWAGSSWYFLRYTDPANGERLADPKKLKYWLSVDLYNGGSEHTTLHLLYSRFWHKFLYDIGVVPTLEPYQRRVQHGIILAPDGQKMSKSRGNVINPDDIVVRYGADVLRLYILFMGEYDQVKAWSDANIAGTARFLNRLWRFMTNVTISKKSGDAEVSALHAAIKSVSSDLERRSFNTAVSHLMVFLNELEKLPTVGRATLEALTVLMAPFTPHLAEECWQIVLKNKGSVHEEQWLSYNEAYIASGGVRVGVQINGKVRADIVVTDAMTEDAIRSQALALPQVEKHIAGKSIKKFIYVKNKIVSIVV